MKIYKNIFQQIISSENLLHAWDKFKMGKRNKLDVIAFERNLEENIFTLHYELKDKIYCHGPYQDFWIHDPKQRHIHKALVRDRVLHHAVFSILNPIFESTFISTSFSCRIGYGTHRGVRALARMTRRISQNNTHPCFVLKCDVRKFFDTVDHNILLSILKKRVQDENAFWLLKEIVSSYSLTRERERDEQNLKGIPIGNLTSQLFANLYLNELDQFVKHRLRVKNYLRYTDDFALVADSRQFLESYLPPIREFLKNRLALTLHPQKISLCRLHQGIDFLGYIVLPHHRLLRTKTRQRIFKKMQLRIKEYQQGCISQFRLEQSLQSYLGVLSHANAYQLSENLKNQFWFWLNEG